MPDPRSTTPFPWFTTPSPLSPNKYHFEFISWLGFQSISFDSKLFRWFMPRVLMPVQAIWRIELLVHHEESSRSDWKIVPLVHIPAHVGWRIQSTTKESSPSHNVTLSQLLQSQRWNQRWTSWRRHVPSMPKKEETTPTQEYPLAVLLTTFSTVLTMSRLMEFYVCVMMFVFMTLSDSRLCNDCWYIVDLLPIMTSVA